MAARRAGIAVTGMALLLGACAPYGYRPEISAFSDGVGNLGSAYRSGEAALTARLAADRNAALTTNRASLHLSQGCSQIAASGAPCMILSQGETSPPQPTPTEAHLTAAEPAFQALEAYVAGLMAVTDATDDQTLAAATTRLTASASGLTDAAAKLYPPAAGASAIIQNAGALAARGLTLYLDSRRMKVLAAVVPRADTPVATLSATVQAALSDIRNARLTRMEHDLNDLRHAFEAAGPAGLSPDDYAARLSALQSAATAFNLARSADPASAAASLRDAHGRLARALSRGDPDHVAIYRAAAEFARQAKALQAALAPASEAAS